MTASSVLASLATGKFDGLLQTSRAAAFGVELYGRTAITEASRYFTFQVEGARRAGSFELAFGQNADGAIALASDVLEGRVIRLWHLGPSLEISSLSCLDIPRYNSTDVPFDFDLQQEHPAFGFAPGEHAALRDGDVPLVAGLKDKIRNFTDSLWSTVPVIRPRLLVFRAVSDAAGPFGLAIVFAETDGVVRQQVRAMAGWLYSDNKLRLFPDLAGAQASIQRRK
jgi:hypothetical protein